MGNRTEDKPEEPPEDDRQAHSVSLPSNDNGGTRKPAPSRYIQTSEEDKASSFEKFAVCFCWFFVILFFPLSLCCCIIVVPEYIRLIILRLGRLRKGAKGPGLVLYLPCIDDVQPVDMRTNVYKVSPQEVLTKDSVTITVNAVIYYCIHDAIGSIIQVDNVTEATLMIAKVTLRNIVGSKTLNVLLSSRQALSREILQAVAGITARWGVRMERVDIMNISLPNILERSLASEAEAVRVARAKIILAEGEARASKALKEASDVMAQNHITLQLRHLQVLPSLATEKRVTIIFPIPLEIMEPFFDEEEWSAMKPDDQMDGSESELSDFSTPKVYIEGLDLPGSSNHPEGSEPSYGNGQNLTKDRKDEDADNSTPTSPWRLPTYFRRQRGAKDAKPLPGMRSQKAPVSRPKGETKSEAYPLLPSTPEIRPSPPAPPTLPPIPPPPTPRPSRPIPHAPTLPPIPPPPTLPPIPPPPTLPPIPPRPTLPPIPPPPTLPPIPPPPTLPPIPPPPTPTLIPSPPTLPPPPPPPPPESQNKPDDNYYF